MWSKNKVYLIKTCTDHDINRAWDTRHRGAVTVPFHHVKFGSAAVNLSRSITHVDDMNSVVFMRILDDDIMTVVMVIIDDYDITCMDVCTLASDDYSVVFMMVVGRTDENAVIIIFRLSALVTMMIVVVVMVATLPHGLKRYGAVHDDCITIMVVMVMMPAHDP